MKITKIKIKNLFGITERELDGRSVELSGTNGAGKSSVIDAVRYALTNASDRDFILRDGTEAGEVLIETDTGLSIDRMKRKGQVDYKCVKENHGVVTAPEAYLKTLFTELQLDPTAFINMSKKEQNRTILNLIDFEWDLNWIKDQFGEIPEGINYEQNILDVLRDIQSENSAYYKTRQEINTSIRNNRAFIKQIADTIPENYDVKKWESFDAGEIYRKLSEAESENNRIQRAKIFADSVEGKKRGIEADLEIALTTVEKQIEAERSSLKEQIARLQEQIRAAEEKINGLSSALEDKKAVARSQYEAEIAKLEKDAGTAAEYTEREIVDVAPMKQEIEIAEKMKSYINEYNRMMKLEVETRILSDKSQDLTDKIELARSLPGMILEQCSIPVEGLTIEDGNPLINGLPVSNLSDGEKLKLCVDVTLAKPNGLQIILIDGVERLSEENRNILYQHCKDKGVQFIATRTTDASEMEVRYL